MEEDHAIALKSNMHRRYNGATRNSMKYRPTRTNLEHRDENDHECDRRSVTETMVGA